MHNFSQCCSPQTFGCGPALVPIPASYPTVFILVIRDVDDDTVSNNGNSYTAVFLLNGIATPARVSAETAQLLIGAGVPFIDRNFETTV